MESCGVKALRNDYVVLEREGESIILAGIDDPNGYAGQKTPQELFSEIRARSRAENYTVLLAHRHNMLETYASAGANLVLAGHRHGGIIRLPLIGGLLDTDRTFFPEYDSGFYIQGSTTMFCFARAGAYIQHPRFLNNPQIAVLILKK